MNTLFKKNSIRLSFIFILLIILSGCIELKPKYNSYDPGDWMVSEPSIYDDKIVWQDFRNDNSEGDIYLYDLSEEREYPIIEDDVEQTDITIFNDKIIWRENYVHIKMYDLTNKNIIELSPESHKYNPEIYENKVIWRQYFPNGSYWIILYDIETNKELLIANNGSTPDIWDNYIVWIVISEVSEFEDDWTTSIYLYDINSNEEMLISNYDSLKFHPRIHKDKIIWVDNRNERSDSRKYDLYLYDITKRKEIQITKEQSIEGSENFDIYEDKIVWTDIRNDKGDIYCYDLTKNKEIPICTDKGVQKDPAIYKNKIVWHDENSVGGQLIIYTIGDDETFIIGIKSTTFYLYISPLMIILIIIILFFMWRIKKKKKMVKVKIENEKKRIII